nr:acyltransferase [uncultured Flavobacterium sp.]
MQRNISLDILKIILAIMVIGMHSNFLIDISEEFNYVLVNGVFRIAVPVFFIINGFFFVNVINKNQIKKWLKRVTILYLIWMVFYSNFWFKLNDFNKQEFIVIAKNIIIGYHHLWYLSAMIGSGIILFWLKDLSNKLLIAVSFSLFFIGATIQYIGNYHVFLNSHIDNILNYIPLYRNFLFFGFPFFVIGYLINKMRLYENIKKEKIFILLVTSLLILIFESLLNYFYLPKIEAIDILFSLIIICPIIFLFVFSLKSNQNSKNITLYSTAIYLIHPFLIYLFEKYTFFLPTAITILTCFLSAIGAYFLIKLDDKYKFIL